MKKLNERIDENNGMWPLIKKTFNRRIDWFKGCASILGMVMMYVVNKTLVVHAERKLLAPYQFCKHDN